VTLATAPGQQHLPILVWGASNEYVLPIRANLIEDDPRSHETVRIMANGSATMLRPGVPGLPQITSSEGSIRVRVPRSRLSTEVSRKVGILRGWGGMVSYCRFKQITEVFTYDGTNALTLLRRPFMQATHGLDAAYWPVGAAVNHATVCTVNGDSATVTLGTPTGLKRVPFTTSPAYDTQGDEVVVHYTPYFYCHVLHAEGEGLTVEPQNAFQEPRFLRFREVNGAG